MPATSCSSGKEAVAQAVLEDVTLKAVSYGPFSEALALLAEDRLKVDDLRGEETNTSHPMYDSVLAHFNDGWSSSYAVTITGTNCSCRWASRARPR